MAEVRLRALGLREVDFGDYDRYLTVLAEDGRKLEILCKNARRGGKQQMNAARQFCFSELLLRERSGRYALREASLVHSFFDLTGDIERYAAACYLSDLAGALTVPEEEAPAVCRLLLGALYALAGGRRDTALVKAAFEWRVMAESGYAPDLSCCGVCGQPLSGPPVYFSVAAGQAAGEACARRVGGFAPLHAGTLHAILHALTSELSKVYAFTLGELSRGQFCTLAGQYVQYHLGRGFDSLDFYRSVCMQ